MSGAGSLALTDLTRRFGGPGAPPAVDHVTVTVAEGELLALVGASGSGKTTTLRIAAGYEPADEGRVELDGRDITRLPPQRRDFAAWCSSTTRSSSRICRSRTTSRSVSKREAWGAAIGSPGRAPHWQAWASPVRGSAGSSLSPAVSSSGWRWRARS